MQNNNPQFKVALLNKDFAISCIGAIAFFLLGTGIAHYLGNQIKTDNFFCGLGLSLFFLMSGYFLRDYFDLVDKNIKKKENFSNKQFELHKTTYLLIGLAGLTAGSIISYTLLLSKEINLSGLPFWVVLVLFVFFFGTPPFRLAARGYGEYLISVIIATIIPAFAFLLQVEKLHPLIPLITFPMTFFYLAMLISNGLKNYFGDMLAGRRSMITVLDWKTSMDLHDWLVLGGLTLLAINSLMGLPWNMVWPLMLTFPVIGFTIYELNRIKNGMKPRWLLLDLSSYSGVIIMLYMILFTVWFR